MKLSASQPLTALLALAVMGGVVAYMAWGGLEKSLVYYWNPDELLAKGKAAQGASVRLGGVVQKGSTHWDPASLALTFRLGLALEGEPSVSIDAQGAPPQMFREGSGAVVEGQFDGHTFHAQRVMVKHSNEYRPPGPGEHPKDVYGTLAPVQE